MQDKAVQMRKYKAFDGSLDDKPWLQNAIKNHIESTDQGSVLAKPLQVWMEGWAQNVSIAACIARGDDPQRRASAWSDPE